MKEWPATKHHRRTLRDVRNQSVRRLSGKLHVSSTERRDNLNTKRAGVGGRTDQNERRRRKRECGSAVPLVEEEKREEERLCGEEKPW